MHYKPSTAPLLAKEMFVLWLIIILLFTSCIKEYSCEGCIGNNQPPVAAAGQDTVITLPLDSVVLDGSKSGDPDGKISEWQWTKIAGPASFTIERATVASTTVRNLKMGAYEFELKVTDDKGAAAKDTVMITVDSIAISNHPPTACAGSDQTIMLPTDTVTLDGSCSTDPDYNITNYSWTKIAGPSSLNIANPNVVTTPVSNLMQGVYQFELKVTDAGGLFSKDTVQVTVDSLSGQGIACDNSIRPTINAQLIQVGTLSQARAFIAVASAGNKILFAGGSGHSSRVDIYDISTNKWSTAELSIARHYIAAVANGNKIFFAGGESGDGTWSEDVVDIYDVSTNTWTVAHLSLAGKKMAAAAVGDKVLFAGGNGGFSGGEARAGRVDIYDLKTDTWSIASLSQYKVEGHVAVTANNKVYISGGSTSWLGNEGPSNKIEIYDNATNTWSTATMLEARYAHAGIVAGNKIYWGGGWGGGGNDLCSVEIKDVITGNTTTQYLYRSTEFSYAVVKDNKIVFFGVNVDNPYKPAADKVDIYDIAGNTWSIGILPFSIEGASIISVNNTIYVAGGFVNGVYNDKVWKLDF